MITPQDQTRLEQDPDGLATYEYMANNLLTLNPEDTQWLADNISRADHTGQYLASAARYLHAMDPQTYANPIRNLVAYTIDRDREHRYLPALMDTIYGPDIHPRAAALSATDNNFRRLYKRLYPTSII